MRSCRGGGQRQERTALLATRRLQQQLLDQTVAARPPVDAGSGCNALRVQTPRISASLRAQVVGAIARPGDLTRRVIRRRYGVPGDVVGSIRAATTPVLLVAHPPAPFPAVHVRTPDGASSKSDARICGVARNAQVVDLRTRRVAQRRAGCTAIDQRSPALDQNRARPRRSPRRALPPTAFVSRPLRA